MNIIDRSAIDALQRMDEVRKAREDRMRNALEILADIAGNGDADVRRVASFVRATAREGLGQETE